MHDRTLRDPLETPEELVLGQFIPSHYHGVMLTDRARMGGFQAALELVVPPDGRVVDLGGGTGVLSFFAASKAAQVWCVERNPELVDIARHTLELNGVADRVELVSADALDFLPPEPVDVVVCEMLHAGLLREKQVEVIASFKERYLARFGPPLPTFIPEATILGLQPIEHPFEFFGYRARIPLFQDAASVDEQSRPLADPVVTHSLIYEEPLPSIIEWQGDLPATADGQVTAVSFITRAVLTVRVEQRDTIDWYLQRLLMPLGQPVTVRKDDCLRISFSYPAGGALDALADTLRVSAFARSAPRSPHPAQAHTE